LRLFSFGGYRLALAALALVVFGAIECPPIFMLQGKGEDGPSLWNVEMGIFPSFFKKYK